MRFEEIDNQIHRLMSLFERGKISPEVIETRMDKLEEEKKRIKNELDGDQQVNTALKYAESELNSHTIRKYIEKFEELLNESNTDLMREFLQTFIYKIELFGKENGKRKGRKVRVHSHIPALTGIELASPRGRLIYPCKW